VTTPANLTGWPSGTAEPLAGMGGLVWPESLAIGSSGNPVLMEMYFEKNQSFIYLRP